MRSVAVVGTIVVALLGLGCQDKVPEPQPPPKPASEPSAAASAEPVASAAAAPSKLVKEDVREGTGPAAKTGDTVSVHYTGTLLDGTKFDSSHDRDRPFEFKLGAGSVIKGWDQGVVGMKKGGVRKLTIPPHLGYGKRGSPPKIGPDATLQFEIELLEIR
jgi:FKBP-type peptidyl-prolyl cis-trans isomerase